MGLSLVDLWFPGETDRAADLDARNAELNARREAMGRQTPEESVRQQDRYNADVADWNAQVRDGFAEGAAEGAAATAGRVRSLIAGPIDWVFSAIPWQVWALGAVALFVWMGGPTWLRGMLAKR